MMKYEKNYNTKCSTKRINLRCRCCWNWCPPVLNTFGFMFNIACRRIGNSFIFVTEGCCSTYWDFSSLQRKLIHVYKLRLVEHWIWTKYTYIWSELVCSRALANCFVNKSSFTDSKLVASSATLGWKRSDFFSGVPTDDSDIGSSLSTAINNNKLMNEH